MKWKIVKRSKAVHNTHQIQNRIQCNELCGRHSQSHRTECIKGKTVSCSNAERWIRFTVRFVRCCSWFDRMTSDDCYHFVNSFRVQIKSKIEEKEQKKKNTMEETIPFDGCLICGKWIRNEIISVGSLRRLSLRHHSSAVVTENVIFWPFESFW